MKFLIKNEIVEVNAHTSSKFTPHELNYHNNNLIDYISKTEEFYINELDSLKTYKKATPKDLIYIKKNIQKTENNFNKNIKYIIHGIRDSKYQLGY